MNRNPRRYLYHERAARRRGLNRSPRSGSSASTTAGARTRPWSTARRRRTSHGSKLGAATGRRRPRSRARWTTASTSTTTTNTLTTTIIATTDHHQTTTTNNNASPPAGHQQQAAQTALAESTKHLRVCDSYPSTFVPSVFFTVIYSRTILPSGVFYSRILTTSIVSLSASAASVLLSFTKGSDVFLEFYDQVVQGRCMPVSAASRSTKQ